MWRNVAGWELLFTHVLTGVLFVGVSVLLGIILIPEHWPAALMLFPLIAWSAWGWYAEAGVVFGVSADLRRDTRWGGDGSEDGA